MSSKNEFPNIVELNIGGVHYTTSLKTLTDSSDSILKQFFLGNGNHVARQDNKGRYFIDRDGVLFRFILDYLRNDKLLLPENFYEKERLKNEADFFGLTEMSQMLDELIANQKIKPFNINSTDPSEIATDEVAKIPACITVGYRGTFALGRDGSKTDVNFRKLSRILVHGRVGICREVFQDTLNESRDPDRAGPERYTSRYFLKHTFLEQAFEMLATAGFQLASSCGSGSNAGGEVLKPGMENEETKWNHYNEFVFFRL